jgi:phosphoserine aminotransferase
VSGNAGERPVLNFYAGPTALPRPVLERVRRELPDYRGTGMSVMEISHRAPAIESLIADTAERARRLLGLGDDHEVLLLQGGGSLQFAMVPLNLSSPGDPVDYVDTGYWARKAIGEPRLLARDVAVVASSADRGHTHVPPPASIRSRPGARYLHLVTNNTVEGTQFHRAPDVPVPVVADMSSDLMAGVFDPAAYDLVYAHAQKNIGISGVTVVIVRRSVLDAVPEGLPTILDYRTHARAGSNYHTPPTFAIYVLGLMLEWLEEDIGGLAGMADINRRKAALLYEYLDDAPFYRCPVEPASRSTMNVVFSPAAPHLVEPFLAAADRAGIVGLAGHRSVGGCRASLFNGVPLDAVRRLVDFLHAFASEQRPALTAR